MPSGVFAASVATLAKVGRNNGGVPPVAASTLDATEAREWSIHETVANAVNPITTAHTSGNLRDRRLLRDKSGGRRPLLILSTMQNPFTRTARETFPKGVRINLEGSD